MRSLGLSIDEPTLAGGGTASHLWRQILIAVLGQDARILRRQGPALGSAMIAASVATGTSAATLADNAARGARLVSPRADWATAYDERFPIYVAAVQATTEVSHRLARA